MPNCTHFYTFKTREAKHMHKFTGTVVKKLDTNYICTLRTLSNTVKSGLNSVMVISISFILHVKLRGTL